MVLLRLFILFASIFIVTAYASANEVDIFNGDLPVFISADRLNQTVLTTPSAVTVIDSAIIEASGFTELPDVFRLVPGFQVARINGYSSAVTYHGFGWEYPNRLQMLINGRSTYIPSISAINWTMLGISLKDIERIEVIRGASAAAYGSNSFVGAINIVTKQPKIDEKFYSELRVDSQDEQSGLIRNSGSLGDSYYRFTVSKVKSPGLEPLNDDKDINKFSMHINKPFEGSDALDTYITYVEADLGVPKNLNIDPHDNDLKSWSAHMQYKHDISTNGSLTFNAYHNSAEENDLIETPLFSEFAGIPPILAPIVVPLLTGTKDQRLLLGPQTYKAKRSDAEIVYNYFKDSGMQFSLGAGVRKESLKAPFYISNQEQVSQSQYRAFFNMQMPVTQILNFNAGGMYEKYVSDKSYFSPRVSLLWNVNQAQSLRVSYSKAYRFPSLVEKNAYSTFELDNGYLIAQIFGSDENVEAEKSTNLELAYTGRSLNYPLSWELKAYQEKIADPLYFVIDRDSTRNGINTRIITNIESYEINGIEGELSYRPKENSFIRLHFNKTNKNTHDIIKNINPVRYTENTIIAPEDSIGLIAATELEGIQVNAGVYYTGEMEWLSAGDEVDAYTRVDASIKKSFHAAADLDFELTLGGQNIGSQTSEFGNNTETEERFYLNAAIRKR